MPRDDEIAALGSIGDPPKLNRNERRLARLTGRCLDVSLSAIPLPLRVLDIGCGYGDLLAEFTERVPNVIDVVGIDADADLIEEARLLAEGSARFVQAWAEDLPFDNDYFDLVVAQLSYHTWREPRRAMAEVARVLHPAGAFVLAERSTAAIPADLADSGMRVVRRETVARRFGRPQVRAFVASR